MDLSVCLSLSVCLHLPTLFVSLSICLPAPSHSVCLSLSICLSTPSHSVYLSVSICLSTPSHSVCLSLYLSVYTFPLYLSLLGLLSGWLGSYTSLPSGFTDDRPFRSDDSPPPPLLLPLPPLYPTKFSPPPLKTLLT